MTAQHVELQQCIWIDATYLRDAGLGPHLQVVVQPGEIRIVAVPAEHEQRAPSQEGWDVLRALGHDAEPGLLSNAAEEHDRYLYQ
ncbi:MAG: hypothetical protein H0X37_02755 [Herpetosiphonaceae bacterium]|nr:hypothetical protein [Herpetosiphonaceae bacterium]